MKKNLIKIIALTLTLLFSCNLLNCMEHFFQQGYSSAQIPRTQPTKKCPICKELFYTILEINKHIQDEHSADRYKCPQCNTIFNSQKNYRTHFYRYKCKETRSKADFFMKVTNFNNQEITIPRPIPLTKKRVLERILPREEIRDPKKSKTNLSNLPLIPLPIPAGKTDEVQNILWGYENLINK